MPYESGIKPRLKGKRSHSTNYVNEEILKTQFGDKVSTMCSFSWPTDLRSDKFRDFYDVLAAMRVLIPTTFHPKFKNPCWYSNFRIPQLRGKVKNFYNEPVQLYDLMKLNKLNESRTLHCLPHFYITRFPRSGFLHGCSIRVH